MNVFYLGLVFYLCGYSDNSDPPIIFNDFVLDAVEDESVMVFEARVELNSQSAITVTSFSFESKSHPTYMNCLPSCPQINITFRHESDDGHSLLHGTTCWLG